MGGRFVFQKLASRVSESTCLLSSARDLAPLTRHASEGGIGTLGRVFDGSCAHPCTVVPSSHEGYIRDLSSLFPGASAHPSTLALKHYAAKYLYPLPSFSSAAKTSKPTTTGMPSHRTTRPASLDYIRGVKRCFSSSSSDKGIVDWEAQKAIFLAHLEANKENISKACYESEKTAIIAECDALRDKWAAEAKASRENIAALKEKMNKKSDEFNSCVNILHVSLSAVTRIATYLLHWSPRAQRDRERSRGCCGRGSMHVENADVG